MYSFHSTARFDSLDEKDSLLIVNLYPSQLTLIPVYKIKKVVSFI